MRSKSLAQTRNGIRNATEENDAMNMRDFIGGSPLAVLLRLAILSLIVGFLMSFFGISPRDVFRWIDDFIGRIYDMGFDAVRSAIEYIVLGAIVVVPIWLLVRVLRARPGRDA
jgi:hypothetical protein